MSTTTWTITSRKAIGRDTHGNVRALVRPNPCFHADYDVTVYSAEGRTLASRGCRTVAGGVFTARALLAGYP